MKGSVPKSGATRKSKGQEFVTQEKLAKDSLQFVGNGISANGNRFVDLARTSVRLLRYTI